MDNPRRSVITSVLKDFWMDADFELQALPGDASLRKYYRSIHDDTSVIVMDRGEAYDSADDPFFKITGYLQQHQLPVPEVLRDVSQSGILLIGDLGDSTLQNEYEESPSDAIDHFYGQVFEILVRMHSSCRDDQLNREGPFSMRFDFAKLRWELDFFLTHYVNGYRSIVPSARETGILNRFFDFLCVSLEQEPVVFTHRDFHSRNLMVHRQKVYMIDYQDARLGPPEYDLASLLRDAYVNLPESFMSEFLENYYHECSDGRNPDHRRRIFSLMCLQRNLKAIGTFGFQASARKNNSYLKYVPSLKKYILRELDNLENSRPLNLPDGQAIRHVINRVLE